ncbi:MAG: hypothetical protein QOD63_2255, partial [Actinomycetota bacterium]|nr:hypothetical protein [Actinomycetota bacterium]
TGPTTLRSALGSLTVDGFRLVITTAGRRPAPPNAERAEEIAE